jgi:hypothetical protein
MSRLVTRRACVRAISGSVASIAFPETRALPEPRKRRLLFNWDGSMIHCYGRAALGNLTGPVTREQFVSLVFTPIDNAGVDALLFSFGSGNVAEYQSNVLEWPGQADDFKFPALRKWHGGLEVDPADQYRNPKSLADAGHNPPAVIVEECRKRGLRPFVSLRMNDCHDGQHPRDVLPNPELPTFKRQNPDWLVEDLDWWSALDFRRPQVRALKLRVIEEFFDRWDFDGIELDWLRHTLYFPRGTERENGHHLTALMRAVRKSLRERAGRRGRPIEIAVRVPERVEWCLAGGFEVPQWIEEDLCDIVILGQGLTAAPGLPGFRKLMKRRALPLYPCIYPYGNGYRISPDEVVRGTAANLWHDGADGLYAFNWFVYGTWQQKLLAEIANRSALRGRDKTYTLTQRFEPTPREPGGDYIRYNTVFRDAPLPFTLTPSDDPRTLAIPVADSRCRDAQLWIGMNYSKPGDVLSLSLNQKPLISEEFEIGPHWKKADLSMRLPPWNGMLGLPADPVVDLRFEGLALTVPLELLVEGQNHLTVKMKKRGADAEKPLQVNRIELWTRGGAG